MKQLHEFWKKSNQKYVTSSVLGNTEGEDCIFTKTGKVFDFRVICFDCIRIS